MRTWYNVISFAGLSGRCLLFQKILRLRERKRERERERERVKVRSA